MNTEISEKWFSYLEGRERSPETLRAYRSVLSGVPFDLLKADVDEAEEWWQSIRVLAPKSRHKHLTCLRSFYKWAGRYDLVDKDPTRRLDPPKLPTGSPRYITRHQLDKILDNATPELKRAIVLGAWAGLRVAEVAALSWDDIDVDARRIHVRAGKGNSSRSIGAHPLLLDVLLPDVGGNVVTGGEHEYTAGALQRKANRYFKSVGVDATFHQLRHRFGTMTYGATGDPLAVAAAMGHKSLDSTKIYAAVSDDALDRVAAAAIR